MSDNWQGPYLWSFSPNQYGTKKSVTDNGRTVDEIYCISSTGEFVGEAFGSGSATVPIEQRDNYPLVERGDAVMTFSRQPDHTRSGIAVIAIFLVEKVELGVDESGSGTVTYSGAGIAKELQRKILRIPYISNEYAGTTTAWTDTYIYLDAAHETTEDFYNGGIIEIDGYMADIVSYGGTGNNRVFVESWLPDNPDSGGTTTYTIYHGKSATNVTKALSIAQTGWSSNISGTPGGSFNTVNGRKSIDLVNEIAGEAGYSWATNITTTPDRTLFWFSKQGTPTASGLSLYKVTPSNRATMYSNVNVCPVINASRTSDMRSGITRLIVTSGDGVSLVGADPGDLTVPSGFTLDLSESMIINSDAEIGLSSYEIVEQAEQFKDITKPSGTSEATLLTQQRLIDAGVNFLRQRSISGYTYIVTTVARREANIGQSVYLDYEKLISGETIWSVASNLWIRSISNTANSTDGIRYSTYELADYYSPPLTSGNEAVAQRIKKLEGSGSSGSTVIVTGGGTAPGVVDHGLTTGLNHDDHTHYLLADGSRTLSGDLAVASGKEIDGVDISAHEADYSSHKSAYNAHAANPDAHHEHLGEDIRFLAIRGERNVDVQDHYLGTNGYEKVVTLEPNVEIEAQLRVGREAIFELWDSTDQIFRRIFINQKNGQPFLEFAQANDWSGISMRNDFRMEKPAVPGVDIKEISSGSSVKFVDTTVPTTEEWTIEDWRWEIQLLDANGEPASAITTYTTESPTHVFNGTGNWKIKMTVIQENPQGTQEQGFRDRYLNVYSL